MSKQLQKALNDYAEAFDDSFPMFCFSGTKESEVIKIIKTCIDKGKDIYDCGYLEFSNDILY